MEKQQSPEYEEFMICVDPESHLIYTLGLKTKMINIEDDVPSNIKEKAEVALKQLSLLRDDSKHQWRFQSNAAQEYRRREIPSSALLQSRRKVLYPTFEAHSKLPSTLQYVNSVPLLVDISHYIKTAVGAGGQSAMYSIPNSLEINTRTNADVDEVVKEIKRTLLDNYKTEIFPQNKDSEFVLKVWGYNEYLIGNTELINYECVRVAMRLKQPLSVILSETPNDVSDLSCLPLIKRNIHEMEKNWIDWERFTEISILPWYPPKELSGLKKMTDEKNENMDSPKIKQASLLLDQELRPPQLRSTVQDKFIHTPDVGGKSKGDKSRSSQETKSARCCYSGEIDLPFRVRAVGIENLAAVYEQKVDDDYYFYTKPSWHVFERENNTKEINKKKSFPNLSYIKDSKSTYSKDNPLNSFHTNHGNMRGTFVSLAESKGLKTVPHSITIECSIYHGNRLLNPHCKVESTPLPFSFNPRWFQWFTFQNLSFSNLPREARICFTVKSYSETGEATIIACAAHTLFDFYGRMNDGVITLNLWPFYKFDPQYSSMGEFWGRMAEIKSGPINFKESEQLWIAEYARLTFQLDKFVVPLYWGMKCMKAVHRMVEKNQSEYSEIPLIERIPTMSDQLIAQELIKKDILTQRNFNKEEREILVMCRRQYKNDPSALPIFLMAIDWSDPNQVNEAHHMLQIWNP